MPVKKKKPIAETTTNGVSVKIPPIAFSILTKVNEQTRIPMGIYTADAIKEKTQREHPEILK